MEITEKDKRIIIFIKQNFPEIYKNMERLEAKNDK